MKMACFFLNDLKQIAGVPSHALGTTIPRIISNAAESSSTLLIILPECTGRPFAVRLV